MSFHPPLGRAGTRVGVDLAHDARGRIQARIDAIEARLPSLFARLAMLENALATAELTAGRSEMLQQERDRLVEQLAELELEQADWQRRLARIPPD